MNQKQILDELFWYLEAHNDDEISTERLLAIMEDATTQYNLEHNTSFDPYATMLDWADWHNKLEDY